MKIAVFMVIWNVVLVFSDSQEGIITTTLSNDTTLPNESITAIVSSTTYDDLLLETNSTELSNNTPITEPITTIISSTAQDDVRFEISSTELSNYTTPTAEPIISINSSTAYEDPQNEINSTELSNNTTPTTEHIGTDNDLHLETNSTNSSNINDYTTTNTTFNFTTIAFTFRTKVTRNRTAKIPRTKPTTTRGIPTTIPPDGWTGTKILTKTGIDFRNHADTSVQISSPIDGDFETFIRDSSMWVDKSLLIRKIWLEIWKRDVVIRAPPKWGKTINLSMIKFYCQIPLNENGFAEKSIHQSANHLYFNEGKIRHPNGTIEQLDGVPLIAGYTGHLGNHSVIYISGANLTMDDTLDSFRYMIQDTYRRHSYLLRRLKIERNEASLRERHNVERDIAEFCTYYEWENLRQLDAIELSKSIYNLTGLLYRTYKRRIIVLFDDYDHYAHKAYLNGTTPIAASNSSDTDGQFSTVWQMFLKNTLRRSKRIEISIVSGILKANDPTTGDLAFNFYDAYVFDDQDLYPCYGIFHTEFLRMADKRGIDKSLVDNATRWYGGYRTLSHVFEQMYSPYSAARFLSTLQIRNYYPGPDSSIVNRFVKRIIQNTKFQDNIRSLIENYQQDRNYKMISWLHNIRGLKMTEYHNFNKIDSGLVEYAYGVHGSEIFSLMVSAAYASIHEYSRGTMWVVVKIPNVEIFNLISSIIDQHT